MTAAQPISPEPHPLAGMKPWRMLAFMMAVSIVSFVDRQVLSVLVDPIREDLGVTDFQVGLLSGPAFVAFYIVGNLIAGWLADRYNRIAIISAAMSGWSLATMSCGLSASFDALFVSRSAVGLGEGAIGPALHSVLADSFSKRRLPLALSIYATCGSIGPGLAVLFGGVVAAFAATHLAGAPIIGHLQPWQQVFIIVGLPGIVLAGLLLAFVQAPPRATNAAVLAPLKDDLAKFWKARRLLVVLFIVGIGFITASELALLLWLPTLLQRVHGYSAIQVGGVLGPMLIIFGAAGSLFWGVAATVIGRGERHDAAMRTLIVATAIMVPFLVVGPLMPSAPWVLLFVALILLCKRAYVGLGHAAVQLATPSHLRGRVAAIYLACASGIGAFIGPPAIGALTTYVFSDDNSIGVAISAVAGSTAFIGVVCLALALKGYGRALELTQDPLAP